MQTKQLITIQFPQRNPLLVVLVMKKESGQYRYLLLFWLFALIYTVPYTLKAQKERVFNYSADNLQIGSGILVLRDDSSRLLLKDVMHNSHFMPLSQKTINFGISKSSYWLRFRVRNSSEEEKLLLNILQPNLDKVELYIADSNGNYTTQAEGTTLPLRERYYQHQNFILDLPIPPDKEKTIYIRVKSTTPLILPMQIDSVQNVFEQLVHSDMFFSLLFGIVFCMFFYNIIIYRTVRDSLYLYCAFHIFTLSLAQISLQGYGFRFLWPHNPWLAKNGFILSGNLSNVAIALFAQQFLQTKKYLPKLNIGLYIGMIPFIVSLLLLPFNLMQISFLIMQTGTLITAFYPPLLALLTYRKGYRPAKYYLFAWFSLSLGAAILVCKDLGILPVNTFTIDAVQIGFAIEVILLAFALADKINIYKREKESSQMETLEILQKHDNLLREQNTLLESKIKERTQELQLSNESLTAAMRNIKDAQTQLVASEKMASLGFFTAGIAHEINNPVNYISGNVKALSYNFADLFELIKKYQAFFPSLVNQNLAQVNEIKSFEKQIYLSDLESETTELLKGIEEGAVRTADIVKGLRNFSRLGEDDFTTTDIHEGINSTLLILKSSIPGFVTLETCFEADRDIICYPGILNQVFMNLLSNSIYAINAKPHRGEEKIVISTKEMNNWLLISIRDTGIGMSEEIQQKMFEPFYTTKPVGEGTGMGMPLTFKMVEKHGGKLSVVSNPGKGTTITVHIPYRASPSVAESEPAFV